MLLDIIIIGGGPAAMTAALYSLRAGKSVLVIEKSAFGGQIADSPKVENFPTQKSISGLKFSDAMFEQISDLGVEFELNEIVAIDKVGDHFIVKGSDNAVYEGRSIIIATGCEHRKLGIEGEDKYLGKGVSYCAVCDGAFYAGKNVMVIGDANTALQYAINLAGICNHVDVVTLFDKFFADNILVKTLKSLQNVDIFHEYSSLEFKGNGKELTSVLFQNTKTEEKREWKVDAAFVAIGQVPSNEVFRPWVNLNKGFIVTDDMMATKTEGIFAAGDCRDKKVRQLTTACSDGAIASLSAANYLNSH